MIFNMVGGEQSAPETYFAMILVNYPSSTTSCTCTGSSGSKKLSATDTLFYVDAIGTYTVTATDGSQVATSDVSITYEGQIVTQKLSYRLPPEYQEVEYLQSTGTQYLSNVIQITTADEVTLKVAYLSGTWIFGKHTNATSKVGLNASSATNYTFEYGSLSHVLSLDNKIFRFKSGKYYIDDVETSFTYSGDLTSGTISIFGVTSGSSTTGLASCKIYMFKVNRGGTDILDLIPCYRKSDSVAGMWDAVGKTFLENNGTGSFIVGGDV